MIRWNRGGALLLAGLLLSGGAAWAAPFTVTTTGTIVSGSDPGDLLGGSGLVGSTYTLSVAYAGIGPSYFTDGSGLFAQDFGDSIPASITVGVGGASITTALVANLAPSLTEDQSDLDASTSGNDAAGNNAYASQAISAGNNFVGYADLQTAFSYTLMPGDNGTDNYSFSNAADTLTVSFAGTPTRVAFTVPEPATWSAVAAGLIGIALVRRRRAA